MSGRQHGHSFSGTFLVFVPHPPNSPFPAPGQLHVTGDLPTGAQLLSYWCGSYSVKSQEGGGTSQRTTELPLEVGTGVLNLGNQVLAPVWGVREGRRGRGTPGNGAGFDIWLAIRFRGCKLVA